MYIHLPKKFEKEEHVLDVIGIGNSTISNIVMNATDAYASHAVTGCLFDARYAVLQHVCNVANDCSMAVGQN